MGGYELSGDQVIVDALASDKRGCPQTSTGRTGTY